MLLIVKKWHLLNFFLNSQVNKGIFLNNLRQVILYLRLHCLKIHVTRQKVALVDLIDF